MPSRRAGSRWGSTIVREYAGDRHEVFVIEGGFSWQGRTYASLSSIAKEITGTRWNGWRFFGLREDNKGRARAAGKGGGGLHEEDLLAAEVSALRDLHPQIDRA